MQPGLRLHIPMPVLSWGVPAPRAHHTHNPPPTPTQHVSPRPLLFFVAWATCAPYMYVKEGSAVCPAVPCALRSVSALSIVWASSFLAREGRPLPSPRTYFRSTDTRASSRFLRHVHLGGFQSLSAASDRPRRPQAP